MKWLLTAILTITVSCFSYAQYNSIGSIKRQLLNPPSDTDKVLLEAKLAHAYLYYKPDSSLLLAKSALLNAQKLNFSWGEARSYKELGDANELMGNYPAALNYYLKHLRLAEKLNMQLEIARALTNIGLIYHDMNENRLAIAYTLKAKSVIEALPNDSTTFYNSIVILSNAGYYYYEQNVLDSALSYEQDAYELSLKTGNTDNLGNILQNMGLIQQRYKNDALAYTYYRMSAQKSAADKDYTTLTDTYLRMSEFYRSQNNTDSSTFYAKAALKNAKGIKYTKGIMESSTILAGIYAPINKALAYDFLLSATAARDSLFNEEKVKQIQNLKFEEQTREQELNELKLQREKDQKNNLQLSAIALFIPLFFLLLLLISRIKMHHRVVESMSVLSILFLFEFITLLLHPIVAEATHHTPVLELLIFVCIGGFMAPLHHRFTHWLVKRLSTLRKWEINYHIVDPEVEKPKTTS